MLRELDRCGASGGRAWCRWAHRRRPGRAGVVITSTYVTIEGFRASRGVTTLVRPRRLRSRMGDRRLVERAVDHLALAGSTSCSPATSSNTCPISSAGSQADGGARAPVPYGCRPRQRFCFDVDAPPTDSPASRRSCSGVASPVSHWSSTSAPVRRRHSWPSWHAVRPRTGATSTSPRVEACEVRSAQTRYMDVATAVLQHRRLLASRATASPAGPSWPSGSAIRDEGPA